MDIAIVIAILFAITLSIIVIIYEKKTNAKVISSSEKIKKLIKLNETTTFHQLQSQFEIYKHYDNKSNFNKIEPAYLMASEIKAGINFFQSYCTQIRENRETKQQYQVQVEKIFSADNFVDYENLKISASSYLKREERLFFKNVISPIVDCNFHVTMSYSSPKKRVNLLKEETFKFNDLFACLESVSRSQLDKQTYSRLAAVERGDISDSLRYDILSRDNFSCVICGVSSKQGARLHVDHIIPISKGGKSTPNNLRTLCERCNIGKSNKIEVMTSFETNTIINKTPDCAWCGAQMVLRTGPYGEFYGCSNYPKCRFTKKI